jgi:hypothetical protein
MTQAVPPQSTTGPAETVHVPLLPAPSEFPEGIGARSEQPGDPRFRHAQRVQHVLVAAGEVETAEWTLDQVLDDVAVSGGEVGVGYDVEPMDGALESARWALDQAVSVLHDSLRDAARHGAAVDVLAEAAALDAEEVRAVLGAEEAVGAGSFRPGVLNGALAAAV